MANLDITGHVTRPELALPDLSLNTDRYKIIAEGLGPGVVVWDRKYATSPFVHGRYLTNAKKQQGTNILAVRVTGSDKNVVQTHLETLTNAFEQFEYELTTIVEGVTYTYACEPADYTIGNGGAWQRFHLMAYKQEVVFEIPRMPVPVAGPF